MKLVAVLTFGSLTALAQAPDVATIMARVAENQAASQSARKQFVYDEEQHVRLRRANGKPARDEMRLYTVTPESKNGARHLVKLEGHYTDGAKSASYDQPGFEHRNVDVDATVVEAFFEDESGDNADGVPDKADGIPKDLFPLTAKEQARYDYQLAGIETYHGREVFRIRFQPKKHPGPGVGRGDWKGEALIDAAAFQPVMVSTDLAWKVPFAVRTLLGTNIRGLGFSIAYQRFDGDVWFPVTYGGEFEVRGLFFYKRTVSLDLVNKNFRRADVRSNVAFEHIGQ